MANVHRALYVSPKRLIQDSKKVDITILPFMKEIQTVPCPTCQSSKAEFARHMPLIQKTIDALLEATERQKQYLRKFYQVDTLVFYKYKTDAEGKLLPDKLRVTLSLPS